MTGDAAKEVELTPVNAEEKELLNPGNIICQLILKGSIVI
jgi:hypothetical protein